MEIPLHSHRDLFPAAWEQILKGMRQISYTRFPQAERERRRTSPPVQSRTPDDGFKVYMFCPQMFLHDSGQQVWIDTGCFPWFQAHYFGVCHWLSPPSFILFPSYHASPFAHQRAEGSGEEAHGLRRTEVPVDFLVTLLLSPPFPMRLVSALNQMVPTPYSLYFPQLKILVGAH